MPGMSSHPVSLTNPFVVALFHHALFVTGIAWLAGIATVLIVLEVVTRRILSFNLSAEGVAESRARTYLRWAFGALWLFDGILQFQPSMPLGLGSAVVAPARAGTPFWLHDLMTHALSLWYSHPVALAVGVAWLQVGLGLVLLASNGLTGRVAGAISAGWAALIWLVGNGAGGVFIRGATILFGWPGASFFYVVAGVFLALPYAIFSRRFSTVTLRVIALMLVGAAVLQSLPAAGFWHGGTTNALTQMTSTMAGVPQPHGLAWLIRHAGTLAAQMGGGFNLVVILWLVVTGVGLWLTPTRQWRWAIWSLVVGALVVWVIGEDTAIFGGVATDVNSMIPLALLGWCASPHLAHMAPREVTVPREIASGVGAVVATFAAAMVLFSVVSMGVATASSTETTMFIAQNGPVSDASVTAPPFALTDQHNSTYRLGEHPGRVTIVSFLDPRCYTDCPLIAAQLKQLRSQLAVNARLDIVAVAIDPYHEKLSDLRSFISQHQLGTLKNFYFVTGPLRTLRKVWHDYGIGVSMKRTDVMSVHSDFMFIVSANGKLRWIIPDDPMSSSFGTASAVTELRGLLAGQGIH
ncbi:MAG TPA: SCO family protein [Acidimicrobiales bacterium]|nr:SCO family protein [Acidimicrobiales bacterium]